MKETLEYLKVRFVEEYLYWVQGIEIGSRMERRIGKFQKKFERMMKREGISLIVIKDKGTEVVTLSFVPEKEFDVQKKMVEEMIANEGDKIETHEETKEEN